MLLGATPLLFGTLRRLLLLPLAQGLLLLLQRLRLVRGRRAELAGQDLHLPQLLNIQQLLAGGDISAAAALASLELRAWVAEGSKESAQQNSGSFHGCSQARAMARHY